MKRIFLVALLAIMFFTDTEVLQAQQKTPLMEQIEAALGQASTLLDEKKYAEALKAANDAVEYLPQPVKETYKPYAESCYGNLSWSLTLNKQYAPGAEAAKKALTFATSESSTEWIDGNLAHAYLMSGKTQEAEKIYRKYIGKIIGEGEYAQSWSQIILGDFKIMREAGIDSPEIAKIEQIFEQEKAKARMENKTKNYTFPIPPAKDILLTRVSPNGEYAFLVNELMEEGEKSGIFGRKLFNLLLIDLSDGSILFREKHTDSILIQLKDVQFTPDGKQIVFLNTKKMFIYLTYLNVVNMNKGSVRDQVINVPLGDNIRDPRERNRIAGGVGIKFSFNPDASLIALAIQNLGHIYDPQQEKILATFEAELPNYLFNGRNPTFNSSLVFSSDGKHLYFPIKSTSDNSYHYRGQNAVYPGNYPNDYLDIEINRLKTGKGEVLEVTGGAVQSGVVDISQNNTVFTTPGLVIRDDAWYDSEIQSKNYLMAGTLSSNDNRSLTVGNTSMRSIPKDSLAAKTYSLHGKMNETLTKYRDSSLIFSFRGFPAKESNFLRYLPGGERALFFIDEEKGIFYKDGSQTKQQEIEEEAWQSRVKDGSIKGLGIFNLAQEAEKSKAKLVELGRLGAKELKRREENGKEWTKAVEKAEKALKNVKVGDTVHEGLVIKREGNRVLIQPSGGTATAAKWYNISQLSVLGF